MNKAVSFFAAQGPQNLKGNPVTVFPLVEGHSLVTWDTLAHFPAPAPGAECDMKVSEENKKYPVPGFIQNLNGKKVAAIGFMIPSEMDPSGEKVVSFFLARNQATCCFGVMPRINEFIFARTPKGKQLDLITDIPVTVFGTMEVGIRDDGQTDRSLYRMTADKIKAPKGFN